MISELSDFLKEDSPNIFMIDGAVDSSFTQFINKQSVVENSNITSMGDIPNMRLFQVISNKLSGIFNKKYIDDSQLGGSTTTSTTLTKRPETGPLQPVLLAAGREYEKTTAKLAPLKANTKPYCYTNLPSNSPNKCDDTIATHIHNQATTKFMNHHLAHHLPGILNPVLIPNQENPWSHYPVIGHVENGKNQFKVITLYCGEDDNSSETVIDSINNKYSHLHDLLLQEQPDFMMLQEINLELPNILKTPNIDKYKLLSGTNSCIIIYNSQKFTPSKQLDELAKTGNSDSSISKIFIQNNNGSDEQIRVVSSKSNTILNDYVSRSNYIFTIIGIDTNLPDDQNRLNKTLYEILGISQVNSSKLMYDRVFDAPTEDNLDTEARSLQTRCMKPICDNNIYKKKDWKAFNLKYHPDKFIPRYGAKEWDKDGKKVWDSLVGCYDKTDDNKSVYCKLDILQHNYHITVNSPPNTDMQDTQKTTLGSKIFTIVIL